jgi:NADH-quinone oxidoreductase subunit D
MGAGDIAGVTVVETEPAEQTRSGRAPAAVTLNMGPQHPSTWRAAPGARSDGETIVASQPDIGYLHTGIEKEFEVKNYQQAVTLTDRTITWRRSEQSLLSGSRKAAGD